MTLDNQTLALIAVGASVAANCPSCLGHNARTALSCGADRDQIREAIKIGIKVRQGATSGMNKFIEELGEMPGSSTHSPEAGCGCGTGG